MPDRVSEPAASKSRHPVWRRRGTAAALVSGLSLGVACVWILKPSETVPETPASTPSDHSELPASRQADRFLLPDVLASPFRNASTQIAYVGNAACVECHRDEHASYLQTNHSRSFSEVDLEREPPDGEYHHELSGRSYRIYRDGDTLRLREFLQDSRGEEVVLADYAARYSLGSGNYARMYLVQAGDFLIEAPVAWYPRRNTWGMSAGYARDPLQHGFSREVAWGCTSCHAGRVEMIDGAAHRLRVEHLSISCERCHGPGELHVRERRAGIPVSGGIDDSIVNVRHLSRERQEDVCSQCHLSALADISVRGRRLADFRPGLRMSDFRISYRIDRQASRMTVSGQIEQMRLSRCYVESLTMTCATCHNPHARPEDSERMSWFRSRCLECHSTDACGLTTEVRHRRQPDDNCVTCHMPRGPTDIPHLSFTHHRIAVHPDQPPRQTLTESDRLVPVSEISHLPELEQQRLLGLANEAFAVRVAGGLDDESIDDPSNAALADVFRKRARAILTEVRARGLNDPDVESFFSSLYWRRDPDRCIAHAQAALNLEPVPPETRLTVLHNLATSYFDQRRYDRAMPCLEELVTIDRNEIPLMLLGICRRNLGQTSEALRLAEQAVEAAPQRADLHSALGSLYQQLGRTEDAAEQLRVARLLYRSVPQPQ